MTVCSEGLVALKDCESRKSLFVKSITQSWETSHRRMRVLIRAFPIMPPPNAELCTDHSFNGSNQRENHRTTEERSSDEITQRNVKLYMEYVS